MPAQEEVSGGQHRFTLPRIALPPKFTTQHLGMWLMSREHFFGHLSSSDTNSAAKMGCKIAVEMGCNIAVDVSCQNKHHAHTLDTRMGPKAFTAKTRSRLLWLSLASAVSAPSQRSAMNSCAPPMSSLLSDSRHNETGAITQKYVTHALLLIRLRL